MLLVRLILLLSSLLSPLLLFIILFCFVFYFSLTGSGSSFLDFTCLSDAAFSFMCRCLLCVLLCVMCLCLLTNFAFFYVFSCLSDSAFTYMCPGTVTAVSMCPYLLLVSLPYVSLLSYERYLFLPLLLLNYSYRFLIYLANKVFLTSLPTFLSNAASPFTLVK